METFVILLANWQSLAAGLLALFSATIGALLLYCQIRQTKNIETGRIRRHHVAARAMLPLALSRIMEYASNVGQELKRVYLNAEDNGIRSVEFRIWQIPPFPGSDTSSLADAIEGAADNVVQAIAKLVTCLQVHATRIRHLEAHADTNEFKRIPKWEIAIYIRDTAEIYARCESLLKYAREETEHVPPELHKEVMLHALFIIGFRGALREEIMASLSRTTDYS